MLKVKSNYKNKYKTNLICRACGLAEETQNHIMQECTKLHQNDTNKVTLEMIFSENPNQLSQTAQRIQTTMNLLATLNNPRGVLLQSDGAAQTPTQTEGMAPREAQSSPRTPQQSGRTAVLISPSSKELQQNEMICSGSLYFAVRNTTQC